MKNKLKLGWVGAGFVGQVAHLINYAKLKNVDIIALAELRPKLGELVCSKYGIPKYYPNHKALLEDSDIEAVVAIVRRKHTAPVAFDILDKGFDLFTEKPMAPTSEQAQRLVELSLKNNCNYITGYMRCHDIGVQIAKEKLDGIINDGSLGNILYFRSYCFAGKDYCNIDGNIQTDEPPPNHDIWPISPEWLPNNLELEYEKFLNVFIHDINLMRYLFNKLPKITNVHTQGSSGTINLEYENFPGVFEFGYLDTNRFYSEGIDIYFEHGQLQLILPPAFLINNPATVLIHKDKLGEPIETLCPKPDWSWAFRKQAESFVDSVISGRKNIANAKDALQDINFIENIWEKII